jgi:three-Cys-motif partner protein
MTSQHQFGGSWTEEKLNRVRKYLTAYTTIFTQNPGAATYQTIYVDAFAGTGYRTASSQPTSTALPLFADEDAASLQQGSAAIALETEPPFNHYLFIEQVAERAVELQRLQQQFPHRAQRITIRHDNANTFLQQWCRVTNWRTYRAMVFLDPTGWTWSGRPLRQSHRPTPLTCGCCSHLGKR